MPAILFVCLGNICRSPTAEGLMRKRVEEAGLSERFTVDSAATSAWEIGNPPDPRAVEVARRHGVELADLRARRVRDEDFWQFDVIAGMDRENIANLERMRPRGSTARIGLLRELALGEKKEIPDPYYGTLADFEATFAACDRCVAALIERLGD